MHARLFAALLSLGLSSSVQAADMGRPVPVFPGTVSGFSWTGFSAGVLSGYEWARVDDTGALGESSNTPRGLTGGVFAGYTYQSGALVYGLEASFSGFGQADGSSCGRGNAMCQDHVTWQADTRARLGYAFDRFLLSASGGLAVAEVRSDAPWTIVGPYQSDLEPRFGWTLGAGLDYALTSSLFIGIDYKHADFGSRTVRLVPDSPGFTAVKGSSELVTDTVAARIGYRF